MLIQSVQNLCLTSVCVLKILLSLHSYIIFIRLNQKWNPIIIEGKSDGRKNTFNVMLIIIIMINGFSNF